MTNSNTNLVTIATFAIIAIVAGLKLLNAVQEKLEAVVVVL